jgi:transcriptional regulator with XRE-family HTH domain
MPRQRTPAPKRKAGPEIKAFGRALAAMRAEQGITQETLGFDSEYHPKYIGMLERGLYSPSLTAIVRLSDAMRVAPSELIRRMELLLPKRPKETGGKPSR